MADKNNTSSKDSAALPIKKAQGTLNKVLEMVEKGRNCQEVIQQLDAAIGLLKSSRQKIVHNHIDICLKDDPKNLEKIKDLYKLT